MKKIILYVLAMLFVNTSFADVNSFMVGSNKETVSAGETFYIGIFATDSQGLQISGLKPMVDNIDGLQIGNFVNCSTAEGRELCKKYDASFEGLEGAYATEVKVLNKAGDFNITVYADSTKSKSGNISVHVNGNINESTEVKEPMKVTSKESVKLEKSTSFVNTPKTGGELKGFSYIYMGIFTLLVLFLSLVLFSKRRVVYYKR